MEVLATASSVLAVVSLALQLADNVQRLVDFWDSVKEAPVEAAEIRFQLKILGTLLRSIEQEGRRSPNDDGSSLGHGCLLVCKGSIAKLEKLSNGWEQELSRNGLIRRKWSCLRKALKGNELDRYWCELERAKSTLIMYLCLRNGQLQDSLHRLMMRVRPAPLENCQPSTIIRTVGSVVPTTIGNRFKKMHLGTTVYELHLSFGVIHIRMVRETVIDKCSRPTHSEMIRHHKHWKIVATLLPKFALWRVLEFSFTQRFNSIGAGLRTFNIRPGWSPIFEYSSRGDLQSVRRLVEDGLASPNDVDPDGWTVLHWAAGSHQATMCQLLLALGAVPDPVTKRQETPLLVATRANERSLGRGYLHPRHDESTTLDTMRVLVEQGKNDPMQSGDIGYNSIFMACKNRSSRSLLWLIHQDEYELDLSYTTPGGNTAASLFVQREDLSPTLFEPILREWTAIEAPCARGWRPQFANGHLRILEPSMIQYAVWTWYDNLLNSYEQRFPNHDPSEEFKSVPSPLATIETLIAYGADFYCNSSLVKTLLRGLVLNIVQFDGEERPLNVSRYCMSRWLELVRQLGFDLKDYLRIEAEKQKGRCYNIGAGIVMIVCFDEDTAPHIWTVFQGPSEREKNVVMNRITSCANWKEWQFLFALPKPPPPLKTQEILGRSINIIVVQKQCGCPEFGVHLKSCKGPNIENKNDSPQPSPGTLTSAIPSRKRGIVSAILYYMISATRYRREFTFYVFVLVCFFGCSYFARVWIAGGFYLALKLFEDTISYWI